MSHPINSCQLPPFLQSGDLVTVIAPSGALKETQVAASGLAIWRSQGYRIRLGSNYRSGYGYLAGTDRERRQVLAAAWNDPECKAIVCLRGGYGSARLLEAWDWQQENSAAKWLIGFSDITCLLWSLARVGIASLHAPVLTTLAAEPKWSLERLFGCLRGETLTPLQGQGWGGGKANGILLPANLTVATHLLQTPLQPSLTGAILAFEDVTEYPYRIDRQLTQWRLMGAFKTVKGIALGRFSRCDAPKGSKSWKIEAVLRDRLGDLDIPIVSDLPFGHDGVNAALLVGRSVELDGEAGILSWN
ncbi:LD-carboxypeptidase [Myxosarcina sp. GI1]|uniref:S66 peptidase family protein n=1 Tax=Myxosarcina sp. GI1 TaxID=1541065 RepID=UPI000562B579|nr:LD-carboxypeptidase [Myxosarcina sp. GI1]